MGMLGRRRNPFRRRRPHPASASASAPRRPAPAAWDRPPALPILACSAALPQQLPHISTRGPTLAFHIRLCRALNEQGTDADRGVLAGSAALVGFALLSRTWLREGDAGACGWRGWQTHAGVRAGHLGEGEAQGWADAGQQALSAAGRCRHVSRLPPLPSVPCSAGAEGQRHAAGRRRAAGARPLPAAALRAIQGGLRAGFCCPVLLGHNHRRCAGGGGSGRRRWQWHGRECSGGWRAARGVGVSSRRRRRSRPGPRGCRAPPLGPCLARAVLEGRTMHATQHRGCATLLLALLLVQNGSLHLVWQGLGSPHTWLYHAALPLVLLPVVRRGHSAAGATGCSSALGPRQRECEARDACSKQRQLRCPASTPARALHPPATQFPRFRPFCERLVQAPGSDEPLGRLRDVLSLIQCAAPGQPTAVRPPAGRPAGWPGAAARAAAWGAPAGAGHRGRGITRAPSIAPPSRCLQLERLPGGDDVGPPSAPARSGAGVH